MGGAGDRLGQHLPKLIVGIAPVAGNGIRDGQDITVFIVGVVIRQGYEILTSTCACQGISADSVGRCIFGSTVLVGVTAFVDMGGYTGYAA